MTKRVISAIVMIAVFVPFLIIGGIPFTILMSVISVFGLYELLHIRETKKEFPLYMKLIAYLMVIFFTTLNASSAISNKRLFDDFASIAVLNLGIS